MKLHIVYKDSGQAVADYNLWNFVIKAINRIKGTEQELQVTVSNLNVIDAFRLAVKTKLIAPEDILFYNQSTDNHPIRTNKHCELILHSGETSNTASLIFNVQLTII